MIPRSLHRAYARVAGYFWLPCPGCGRMFGGHERPFGGTFYAEDGHNWIMCPRCPGDIWMRENEHRLLVGTYDVKAR